MEVQRQVRLLSNNQAVFAPPKCGKTRTVPMPASVRDALAARLAQYPAKVGTTPLAGRRGRCRSGPAGAEHSWTGGAQPQLLQHLRVEGRASCRRGRAEPPQRHARTHHYYASVLLDAGENIKAVSSYLGHADPGFTLRTYTHLMPASAERTRTAVDSSMAGYTAATSTVG